MTLNVRIPSKDVAVDGCFNTLQETPILKSVNTSHSFFPTKTGVFEGVIVGVGVVLGVLVGVWVKVGVGELVGVNVGVCVGVGVGQFVVAATSSNVTPLCVRV